MKTTKKEIKKVLRTMDRTQIYKLANKVGVDTSKPLEVYYFVQDNAPNQRVYNQAYRLVVATRNQGVKRGYEIPRELGISNAIRYAKRQISDGYINTPYVKVLIEGNKNIYWASPDYGHSDYNKSIAMENNERNRRAMELVNGLILRNELALV